MMALKEIRHYQKFTGFLIKKLPFPEVSQVDHSPSSTGNAIPILGTASAPGGCRSIPCGIV